ncbi:hypothetical protein [Dapis sp. BLCC M172]|uniref:hypothetical protein n=1 Tax=Dapis sp. BLCC M172 TaxID=2975281 RepID=UPI003CEE7D98
MAVDSNPTTAKDTSKRWQDGSTPSSDSEDLSRLNPGDKACYKNIQFTVKQNLPDEQTLISDSGATYSYSQCRLPEFPSFKIGEKILYNGENATYCGHTDKNWQILIMSQGFMARTEVDIDQCTKFNE